MTAPAIDTIIFDLGNVLIDWNIQYLYQQVIPDETRRTYFLTHICNPAFNAMQDAGRSFDEATEVKVAEFPDWEAEIRAYYGRYPEQFKGPIQATVDILSHLKDSGKFRLLGLTNWPADSFPWARETFPFINWLEGVVVSGDEKVIKPDPKIYQILFERYEVEPTRALYTDDNLNNVEAGQALGLNIIHFQSSEQFQQELITYIGPMDQW